MAKRVILAVDDEPMITRLVSVNLERAGYEVNVAHDGYQALDALKQKEPQPDLILLDVTMPYMDGFEMLERIKADPNLKDIPVIMVTARNRDSDIVEGRARGALRYLTKPINPKELLGMVHEVLDDVEAECPDTETGAES